MSVRPGPRSWPGRVVPGVPDLVDHRRPVGGPGAAAPTAGQYRGRGGRPEKHPRRLVLDAIFYLVRGGIAWAALPRDFPPHQTVYGLFGRWARHGV